MDFSRYLGKLVVVQIPDETGRKFLKGTIKEADDKFILLNSNGRDHIIGVGFIINLKECGGA